MSEEATKTEETKKKGSKLPIIIALIIVVAGGGFFGMQKMKAGQKQEKPKVELGEIVTTKEFLCNLRDPETYVRTEIAFQMAKGFDTHHFSDIEPAVRDAVNLILASKTQAEISTTEGKLILKQEIAARINEVLNSNHEHEDGTHEEPTDGAAPEEGAEHTDDASEHVAVEIPKGWDSAEGPVLKVYFTSFATQ